MFSFVALAAFAGALSVSAQVISPYPDGPTVDSCESLKGSCNASTIDVNNVWNYPSCALFAICSTWDYDVVDSLASIGAPHTQPRMPESTFNNITNGADILTQQSYVDAYHYQISVTPGATNATSDDYLVGQYQYLAAWTGFCGQDGIPYQNFADFFQYESTPGVCPAVQSCDASINAGAEPCVPQPITDNGSCAEVVNECTNFIQNGLFQSTYCVLASMCYAESDTDVLINNMYPSYITGSLRPTTATEARLSIDVFHNMTGGSDTMGLQNAIDAYYGALTNTWQPEGPFLAGAGYQTNNNGPYPTSADYVENFWSIIAAWTGFCDTLEIPYNNLADYLSYAVYSNYHPTC
ncbi:hypothetical protein CONPUDRAFT_129846 [Coniophora puteana RWD-64-598 SS2]|uniref:Glycoside hydrolase family 23 protein n=1 Tax=Coniophora puteana (strain RWD-64-598) TaxID=741705 RepID=A0A5M3MD79_CONPW|nr:uncharacterized protein CONPUDRAFT_129846 [Coniophora puteana RWD-64-598 SS2]EIW76585.1 hypothetical protein CONPUDRAFT_129846 [Coniophora puteana RWD-64-598 SS2]